MGTASISKTVAGYKTVANYQSQISGNQCAQRYFLGILPESTCCNNRLVVTRVIMARAYNTEASKTITKRKRKSFFHHRIGCECLCIS